MEERGRSRNSWPPYAQSTTSVENVARSSANDDQMDLLFSSSSYYSSSVGWGFCVSSIAQGSPCRLHVIQSQRLVFSTRDGVVVDCSDCGSRGDGREPAERETKEKGRKKRETLSRVREVGVWMMTHHHIHHWSISCRHSS